MKAKYQRLWILSASLMCLLLATGIILYALEENITFFYTPSDLLSKHVPSDKKIRLGGMVEKGSINRDGIEVRFVVTDFKNKTAVHYQGITPDLFREGQGVVAEGLLTDTGIFQATTLLAKHDENYMPPEIAGLKEDQP